MKLRSACTAQKPAPLPNSHPRKLCNSSPPLPSPISQLPSSSGDADRLLTKEEVAVLCHVTTRCVEKWMARGALRYAKIGRTVRFRPQDVEEHVSQFYRDLPN